MYHCLRFALGNNVEIRVHLAMDNSAAKSFPCRVGVGRIRHTSLRILWIQMKVEENFMTVGKVSTKENVSGLGTKRLTRDKMNYLMYLCKIYNTADSQFVGSSFAEKVEEGKVLRMGIKSFRQMGLNTSSSKSLMRVLLINALSSTMAMDPMDAFAPSSLSASASPMSSSSSGFYSVVFGFIITFLCLLAGFIWVTAHFGAELQNRLQQMRVKSVLPNVLALLRGYASEHGIH